MSGNEGDTENLDSSRGSGAIYLVGGWVSTGPRANDCYFEVGYVTTDFVTANEKAKDFTDAVIMEADDGSSFVDWDQKTVE